MDTNKRHTPLSWQFVPQKRRLLPEDPFYEDGNIHCSVQQKQITVEEEEETKMVVPEFPCHVSGCPTAHFTTVQDYELHYNSAHRNVCGTCSRVFPSVHLLDIHVMEWHDAMFQVLAEKQPMYECLVQSCGIKFQTAEERKLHLVREHHYPKDFRFDRRAKNRGNIPQPELQHTHAQDDSMDVGTSHTESHQPSTDIKPAPRQYRVPKNICFGRGGARTFQRPHTKQHQGKKHNKTNPSETRRNKPTNKTNFEHPEQQMHHATHQESYHEQTMGEHQPTENEPDTMESQDTMDTR
ncbi:zinc finger protein 511-like [Amphiura filiformis]|uniref:zinc finger protein 511-like n=1 Tax=Amphiura filiformis TaxID=82378 RepID=UPI003B218F7F